MHESIFPKTIERYFKFERLHSYTVTELLRVILVSGFLVWYFRYLWGRRKLYLYSYKLPGPFGLPFIGSALSFVWNLDDLNGVINSMFDKYPGLGRIWLLDKLFYLVSDPVYFEILLSHPQVQNKDSTIELIECTDERSIFSAPVEKWKRNRKIIMPTFNMKILEKFVQVFSLHSEKNIETLKDFAGKGEFDIIPLSSNYAFDIITETAMGIKGCSETEFTKWVERTISISVKRVFNVFYRIDTIFYMLPIGKERKKLATKVLGVIDKIIKEKRNANQEKLQRIANKDCDNEEEQEEKPKWKPSLDLLLELTYQEGSTFTDEQLKTEVNTLVVAGSDTSSITNCFVLMMLGMHQNIQEKVYQEVMTILGNRPSVEPEDLPKMKYLGRVIKETLRVFPIASVLARVAHEDIKLDDNVTIAAGATIAFSIFKVHRSEKYWPDPLKFDPDRFLPQECAKRHPCAFIPFSYGPRNCLGIKYAMMSMKVFLAQIVRSYKIYTSYKTIEEVELYLTTVMKPTNGFKISIENR